MLIQKTKNGFTLLEILVALMVISVIVGISLPNFLFILEKFNLEEGKQAVWALYLAQKQYYLENNAFTPDTEKLDVSLRLKNFQLESVLFTDGTATYTGYLSRRRGGQIIYWIGIKGDDSTPAYKTGNGQLFCWDGPANPGICQKLRINVAGS